MLYEAQYNIHYILHRLNLDETSLAHSIQSFISTISEYIQD